MIGFVFCHGWGLDPAFFNHLRKILVAKTVVVWDLGYFGTLHCPQPPQAVKIWIGVGHSFGLIKLLESKIPFTALIGIQSFVHFLGNNPSIHRRQMKAVKVFEKSFETCPMTTLTGFREICGMLPPLAFNRERLITDLVALKTNYTPLLNPDIPMLLIGNQDDPIVPPDLFFDNFQNSANIKLIMNKQGGHGVPLSSVASIARQIDDFVKQFIV